MDTPHIWLVHAEDEPPEGPYWSRRVAILAHHAAEQGYDVSSIAINEAEQRTFSNRDLFFYRITHRSLPRVELRERIERLKGGFLFNRCAPRLGNKLAFYHFAREHHFATRPTCSDVEWLQQEEKPFSGPYLVKKSFSSQGRGIYRTSASEDVAALISSIDDRAVVQQQISLQQISDVRLLMVGEEVVGSMRRVLLPNQGDEFRANLSLGSAYAEPYQPSEHLLEEAKRFMLCSGLDFAGLDLLEVEGGLFLESNLSPGLEGISKLDPALPIRLLEALCIRAHTNPQ